MRIFAMMIAATLLYSCSPEPDISMPPTEATRYVLDLSGSNDTLEQFERLKPEILREIASSSIGNPFSTPSKGPVDLSITFIVGSASQARVANLVSSSFGLTLFRNLQEVYGRTNAQIQSDWPLVIEAQAVALSTLQKGDTINCVKNSSNLLIVNLGEDYSNEIAQIICDTMSETLFEIQEGITNIVKNTQARGSDIFGTLRELENWTKKLKDSEPKTKLKIVIASDMVHWTKGSRDLFGANGILIGKMSFDEVCNTAKEQADISSLRFDGVEFQIIGRGNSRSVTADEGEQLSIFWDCFAETSGFKLTTITDGRG